MSSNVIQFPVEIKKATSIADVLECCSSKYPEEPVGTEVPRGDNASFLRPLKKHYEPEWNSYRNMVDRVRKEGRIVHPAFRTFQSFLENVGLKPSREATLDRIDPEDPEYAPGKVRWASKMQQANNRTNTIYLEFDGKRLPLTEWAALIRANADLMRRRHARGWTDKEIITGEIDQIERDRRKHPAAKGPIDDIARKIRANPGYSGASFEPYIWSLYRAAQACLELSQTSWSSNGESELSAKHLDMTERAYAILEVIRPILSSSPRGRLLLQFVMLNGPLKFPANI